MCERDHEKSISLNNSKILITEEALKDGFHILPTLCHAIRKTSLLPPSLHGRKHWARLLREPELETYSQH